MYEFGTSTATNTTEYYVVSQVMSDINYGILIGICVAIVIGALKGRKIKP